MSNNLIAGLIGTVLIGGFLLYYVISVRSVPLSIIIVSILLMVARTIYDEVNQNRNSRKSQPPASDRGVSEPGNRHP